MEVSILLCYGGTSRIPGHPCNSITRCSSANSKSIQIMSWWSGMHFCVSFVFLLLLYSSGPCYLHSCLTSSDVFTWEMCNTTPWFTEEDNLCFRQGDAVTGKGVGFPSSAIYRAWDISPAVSMAAEPKLYVHRLICWQPNSQLSYTLRISLLLSQFSSPLSHSGLCSCLPYTVSDSICLYPCFHLTPPFSSSCSLSHSLSLPLSGG